MFRRIIHEHWHDLVPVIAFLLTFAVFVVALIRALLARKEAVAHMAALPLDLPLPAPRGHSPLPEKRGFGCSDTCRRCSVCRNRHEERGGSNHHDHDHDHDHGHELEREHSHL